MLTISLFFFPLVSNADELYWVDYDLSLEYNWEYLQSSQDYSVQSKTGKIFFNFGKNIQKTCQGQKAAVVFIEDSYDYCALLGLQDNYHVTPFNENDDSGLILLYESGSLCANRYVDNLKHRVEFKFICSESEGSFVLATDPYECTTILEYRGKSGCAQEYKTSLFTKILLFSIYSVLAGLLIWICVETFDETGYPTSRVIGIAKGKVLSHGVKETYSLV